MSFHLFKSFFFFFWSLILKCFYIAPAISGLLIPMELELGVVGELCISKGSNEETNGII